MGSSQAMGITATSLQLRSLPQKESRLLSSFDFLPSPGVEEVQTQLEMSMVLRLGFIQMKEISVSDFRHARST